MLVRHRTDGSWRAIEAIYVEGLGRTEDTPNLLAHYYRNESLSFKCPDPLWFDAFPPVTSIAGGMHAASTLRTKVRGGYNLMYNPEFRYGDPDTRVGELGPRGSINTPPDAWTILSGTFTSDRYPYLAASTLPAAVLNGVVRQNITQEEPNGCLVSAAHAFSIMITPAIRRPTYQDILLNQNFQNAQGKPDYQGVLDQRQDYLDLYTHPWAAAGKSSGAAGGKTGQGSQLVNPTYNSVTNSPEWNDYQTVPSHRYTYDDLLHRTIDVGPDFNPNWGNAYFHIEFLDSFGTVTDFIEFDPKNPEYGVGMESVGVVLSKVLPNRPYAIRMIGSQVMVMRAQLEVGFEPTAFFCGDSNTCRWIVPGANPTPVPAAFTTVNREIDSAVGGIPDFNDEGETTEDLIFSISERAFDPSQAVTNPLMTGSVGVPLTSNVFTTCWPSGVTTPDPSVAVDHQAGYMTHTGALPFMTAKFGSSKGVPAPVLGDEASKGVMVEIRGDLVVLDNDGDAPAYPRWYLSGPIQHLTIENVSTGQSLVIAKPIPDNGMLIVDTRHRMMYGLFGNAWDHDELDAYFAGVRYQDMFTQSPYTDLSSLQFSLTSGGLPDAQIINAWDYKTPGSQLFPIPVGQTTIKITMLADPNDIIAGSGEQFKEGEVLVEVPRRWLVA